MKRIIPFIICLIMLFAAFSASVTAAGNMEFRVKDVSAKLSDGEIRVPVECTSNPGYVLGKFIIHWDKSEFSLMKVEFSSAAPDYGSAPVSSFSDSGSYTVLVGDPLREDDLSSTGTFMTLVFKPASGASAGSSKVSLDGFDFANTNLDQVGASGTSGKITLTASSGSSGADKSEEKKDKDKDKTETENTSESGSSDDDSSKTDDTGDKDDKTETSASTAVSETEAAAPATDTVGATESSAEGEKTAGGSSFTVLWICIAVAAGVAVCAAVIIMLKRNKGKKQ